MTTDTEQGSVPALADPADLAAIDIEALERAMQIGMAGRCGQLMAMLKDRPWAEVARFAAYNSQVDSMNLLPWQGPPCHHDLNPQAARWAARLVDAGLSVWEPLPVEALGRAKRKAGR
jgi:hypothetical protein